jgi:AraC-like DNA-binding protein/mannose-6-phosphate isomerase-like protein (cupin superfamily)
LKVYTTEEYIKEGDSIGMFYDRMPRSEKEHRHDFIEIIYVLSGTATEKVDDKVYEVKHGDMLFINYGCVHSFESSDGFSFYNICFSPEIIADSIITKENATSILLLSTFNELCQGAEGSKITFFGKERTEIESLISAMYTEYVRLENGYASVMESYLNIILTKMIRKNEVGIHGAEISDVWLELSEFIDENISKELTLETLAKKCFYNPSYLSRAFKENFGVSPIEYITKKRVQLAAALLDDTSMSLEEIQAKVGFSDSGRFARTFTKHTGISPSKYRSSKKVKNRN